MIKKQTWLTACCSAILAACSTVPIENPATPNTTEATQQRDEYLQRLDQQFQQGKSLFLAQKYEEAARILLPLAQQGQLDAQYSVGYMYHYGYGLPRNEKEATRWITTAAARGHLKAQQALQLIDDYYGQSPNQQ